MDLITIGLGAKVIDVLRTYLKKGATQLAKDVGVTAVEKIEGLLKTLKTQLSGDKEATDTLTHFEERPDRYKEVLMSILEEKLAQDRELATELNKQIEDLRPTLNLLQEINVVDKEAEATVLDADEITRGNIKAEQKIGENKGKSTVVRVKRIEY